MSVGASPYVRHYIHNTIFLLLFPNVPLGSVSILALCGQSLKQPHAYRQQVGMIRVYTVPGGSSGLIHLVNSEALGVSGWHHIGFNLGYVWQCLQQCLVVSWCY